MPLDEIQMILDIDDNELIGQRLMS